MNNFEEESAQSIEDPETTPSQKESSEDTSTGDSEPLRVREMIKLYNIATEQNKELKKVKSMYRSSSKSPPAPSSVDGQSNDNESCNLSVDMKVKEPAEGNDVGPPAGTFCVTTSEDRTLLRQCECESEKKVKPPDGALEKSYSSSTTIRRTDNGVRIIIDIFCEAEDKTIDVVGSLVETTIPSSRILTEFTHDSIRLTAGEESKDSKKKLKASPPKQI